MLKSRTLPVGFDTAQTLNNAYDATLYGNLGGHPSFFHPPHQEYDVRRPITTGPWSLAEESDGNISPRSVLSNFVGSHPTPASFSLSENFSPISPSSERSHIFTPSTSQGTSPRASDSFARSSSFPTIHQVPRHRHGSPLQQRLVRSRAGSSAFPMPHTNLLEQSVCDSTLQHYPSQPHLYSHQNPISSNTGSSGSDSDHMASHAIQPIMDTSILQGSAWPGASGDSTICSPVDASCFTDIVGHRLYGSMGPSIHAQNFQPTWPVQSALTAPPNFHPPEWTASNRPTEASFTAAPDYSQDSPAYHLWLTHHMPSTPQTILSHPCPLQRIAIPGTNYIEPSIVPNPKPTEEWPQ